MKGFGSRLGGKVRRSSAVKHCEPEELASAWRLPEMEVRREAGRPHWPPRFFVAIRWPGTTD